MLPVPVAVAVGESGQATPARRRNPRRRRRWTVEDLATDPAELLAPFAEQVASLSRLQRYEDAARVRDEAEHVRHLLVRHRLVESLRRAGRTVLLVDGEGTVELDGGLDLDLDAVHAAHRLRRDHVIGRAK